MADKNLGLVLLDKKQVQIIGFGPLTTRRLSSGADLSAQPHLRQGPPPDEIIPIFHHHESVFYPRSRKSPHTLSFLHPPQDT